MADAVDSRDPTGGAFASAAASDPGPGRGADRAPGGPQPAWRPAVDALLRALNHVLGQHAWARERLAPFASQVVRTVIATPLGDVTAAAAIRIDGMLEPVADERAPTVTLSVRAPLDALVAAAGGGMPAAMQHLRIEGDAALASAIAQIAPHLRWDAEDDLARLVGDVAARRISRLAGSLVEGARDLRRRAESATVAHLVHEDPQLVSAPMLDAFRGAVRTLRDDVARLQKRIDLLERR